MFMYRVILGSAVVATVSSLELLLDDAGNHFRPGTAWTKAKGTCAQKGHGVGFHHNGGMKKAESVATWNFTVAKDGCYWVEEFHPDTSACDFSLSSRVPLQIHFCKGLHTAGLVDQSQKAGQWNRLVRLPFYINHSAAIHISGAGLNFEGSGVWAADAFRLIWDAENCHDEETESDEAVAPVEQAAKPAEKEDEATKVAAQEEPKLPLLQALVDDADAKVLGSTLEPVPQCPATASKTFRHDAQRKDRRAQATFHFNPPHDGCYIIEEHHPLLDQCKASPATKVHVNYCKGLQAAGTVDQSTNGGQWTFVAALPFYAGHPGNVTLSNEGTQAGTLAVFDQVRFTWSGKSCSKRESHPRQAQIRMTVEFKKVQFRLAEFGQALKTKLASLANVPETALRLMGLRSGSIIAEFLVLPSVVDDAVTPGLSCNGWSCPGLSAAQTMERLSDAISKNAADLCVLTGASLEGCNVEFKDLGVALPTIFPVVHRPLVVTEEGKNEVTSEEEQDNRLLIGALSVAAIAFVAIAVSVCFFVRRHLCTIFPASLKAAEAANVTESKAMELEEGKAVDEKKPTEEEIDNASTLAPSSDKHSEPSLNGDIENHSHGTFA